MPSHTDTKTKRFIFSMRSYYVLYIIGFCNQVHPDLIVDEVNNFATNNIIQVVGVSHVLGSVQRVSHRLEICASKERRLLQDQVQLGIQAKVQL